MVTLLPVPAVLPTQYSPQQVRLAANYAGGGDAGAVYRFVGLDPDVLAALDTDLLTPGIQVNLSSQNYNNPLLWQKLSSSNGLADL